MLAHTLIRKRKREQRMEEVESAWPSDAIVNLTRRKKVCYSQSISGEKIERELPLH